MADIDLGEQIEIFLDKNGFTPFIMLATLLREMKIRDEPELAAYVKEAVSDYDLTLGNRTQTLLDELEGEDQE